MQTLAAPDVATSTPELGAPPIYSGELPSVADAITIYWAVTGQRESLAAQFGASLITRLVGYAHTDMLGAMQAGEADYVRGNLREFPSSDVAPSRQGDLHIDSEDALALIMGALIPQGGELAVDSLVVAKYRSRRLPLPLYWMPPVRVALALQAERGSEDDRKRVAELQSRLADLATSDRAAV